MDENEEWKPVVGFESHYAVSSTGRLWRTKLYKGRRKDRPPQTQNKILTPRHVNGYIGYCLCVNGTVTQHLAHRLVARAFLGPAPEGTEINHINGQKKDNRVENLEYVTRKQNIAHAISIGIGRWLDRPMHLPPPYLRKRKNH
jgi:hypothetical protein